MITASVPVLLARVLVDAVQERSVSTFTSAPAAMPESLLFSASVNALVSELLSYAVLISAAV